MAISVGVNEDVYVFQAEDGIRDLVRSRGLGDVYKRQCMPWASSCTRCSRGNCPLTARRCRWLPARYTTRPGRRAASARTSTCLLYTSDAADDLLCVDLGGRRISKKKKKKKKNNKKRKKSKIGGRIDSKVKTAIKK